MSDILLWHLGHQYVDNCKLEIFYGQFEKKSFEKISQIQPVLSSLANGIDAWTNKCADKGMVKKQCFRPFNWFSHNQSLSIIQALVAAKASFYNYQFRQIQASIH